MDGEIEYNFIEKFFINTGMGKSTVKRFLFGFGIVTIPLYIIKPNFFFDKDGNMKRWSLITDASDSTLLPLWSAGFIIGSILSMFL